MMSRTLARFVSWGWMMALPAAPAFAQDWYIPYRRPCVKREDVFAFSKKPTVKLVAKDKYEITFAAKGNCDATVSIMDRKGRVVRHLASGVLGSNAPAPFKKNSLEQTLYWNGKDDLDLYAKDPESMKVKVSLGLKPTFEKLILGGGRRVAVRGRLADQAGGLRVPVAAAARGLVEAGVRAGGVPALDRHPGHQRKPDNAPGPIRQLRQRGRPDEQDPGRRRRDRGVLSALHIGYGRPAGVLELGHVDYGGEAGLSHGEDGIHRPGEPAGEGVA
jgi:hypothetical protein